MSAYFLDKDKRDNVTKVQILINPELSDLLVEGKLEKIKNKSEHLITLLNNVFSSEKKVKTSILQEGFNKDYLISELEQIIKARTVERAKYYIKRLIISLNEKRTASINDINLNRWKEYTDILTDSLWIIDKRDNSGAHNAGYWGNFIPQIPNQLIRRYTKKNEWVLDTFLGSGTTLIECKRLGRNGIGIELQKKIVSLATKNLLQEKTANNSRIEIIRGDSSSLNMKSVFKELQIDSVQLVIMHPPYWDIIKFSNQKNDLSNAKSIDVFLQQFGKIVDRANEILDKKRYLAVIIGDKYSKGEWIPLGFYAMQEVLKRSFILKSTIVKNFEDTKGKQKQKELWRYRALAGGFYVFKHEYIFIFQKK